ncbi:MAG: RDD family protein [Bacteroidota bacterium]
MQENTEEQSIDSTASNETGKWEGTPTTSSKRPDPYADYSFPNLLTRVKALVVDLIIILIIFSLASVIIGEIGDAPNWVRGSIFVFSLYRYEPIFLTLFGGTIGHQLVKVKIRRLNDPSRKINILHASIRFITKYLLGWVSFITITSNKRKRGIHDMTAGSIVLNK